MFYDRFLELCSEKGIKPSKVALENGFSKATVSSWKKLYEEGTNVKPTPDKLEKLAAYFDVSVDYLLGNTKIKKPLVNNDEELTEYLYYLKTRPELRMLFKVSSKATKEDVEQAVRIIEAIRNDDKDEPPAT